MEDKFKFGALLVVLLLLGMAYFVFDTNVQVKKLKYDNAVICNKLDSLSGKLDSMQSRISCGFSKLNSTLNSTVKGDVYSAPVASTNRNSVQSNNTVTSVQKPNKSPIQSSKILDVNGGTGVAEPKTYSKSVNEKPASYSTPSRDTRIRVKTSYRLEDRYVRHKVCTPDELGTEEGKAVINIEVSPVGSVARARLNPASTITDENVIEACKKAALQTDFNSRPFTGSTEDIVGTQSGTITYTFVRE